MVNDCQITPEMSQSMATDLVHGQRMSDSSRDVTPAGHGLLPWSMNVRQLREGLQVWKLMCLSTHYVSNTESESASAHCCLVYAIPVCVVMVQKVKEGWMRESRERGVGLVPRDLGDESLRFRTRESLYRES